MLCFHELEKETGDKPRHTNAHKAVLLVLLNQYHEKKHVKVVKSTDKLAPPDLRRGRAKITSIIEVKQSLPPQEDDQFEVLDLFHALPRGRPSIRYV